MYYETPADSNVLLVVVQFSLRDTLLNEAHSPKLRDTLLNEAHSRKFAGDFVAKKVYATLRRRYWWAGMCADVQ